MCVAIVKPKGKKITKKSLNLAWETNPDGGGFAFVNKGKIVVFKSLEQEEFVNKLWETLKIVDETFLIHFRIRTSGQTDLNNCHPFAINKDCVFIHNGMINNVQSNNMMSDTRFFNRDILQQSGFQFGNKAQLKLIETFIERGNKLAFLNSKGSFQIANEGAGTWQNGTWFSNLNHQCTISESQFTLRDTYLDDADEWYGLPYNKKMKL